MISFSSFVLYVLEQNGHGGILSSRSQVAIGGAGIDQRHNAFDVLGR
jgi:hypothetical protein